METIEWRYTRGDTGTEFRFIPPYDPEETDDEELVSVIPSGDTNGLNGEYQSNGWLSTRSPVLRGTMLADTTAAPSELQDRLNVLMAAHPSGRLGSLRQILTDDATGTVVSDLILRCRVASRRIGKRDGMPSRSWQIAFRAPDPLWWDTNLQNAVNLVRTGGGGVTNLTPGGSERTRPIVRFSTTSAGRLVLTEGGPDAGSITLDCTGAATSYVLDCERRTLTRDGGANALSEVFAGGFFDLLPTATTLTSVLSGGLVLSVLTVEWRRGWSFA